MTFDGLRSRWVICFWCAAARASASAQAMSRTRSTGRPVGRDHLIECLALHDFHRQEPDAVVLLEAVDRDDVGMVEGSDGPRLALEAGQGLLVARQRGRQDLDGNVATESRVVRAVDRPHPSCAEARENPVRTETIVRRQRHREPASSCSAGSLAAAGAKRFQVDAGL